MSRFKEHPAWLTWHLILVSHLLLVSNGMKCNRRSWCLLLLLGCFHCQRFWVDRSGHLCRNWKLVRHLHTDAVFLCFNLKIINVFRYRYQRDWKIWLRIKFALFSLFLNVFFFDPKIIFLVWISNPSVRSLETGRQDISPQERFCGNAWRRHKFLNKTNS